MQIPKSTYQSLSPAPRAVAAFLAINRCDGSEAEKLVGSAPRGGGHGKPILALGQAIDAYNRLAGHFFIQMQSRLDLWSETLAYCEAWLAAGGDLQDEGYLGKYKNLDHLKGEATEWAASLEAVRVAVREWADNSGVPRKVFSGPLVLVDLEKPLGDFKADNEVLAVVRELFDDRLSLAW
ncbi:hypothetical protein [Desulfurivibrio dismutans]|uniref:hypothetical protein n=1 Tax=Desulfurivibrio dismutans TaxID=1398908 RepID=UPI0023DBA05D|nr:hypothetical protein [Desulfurivibrio alkaliphilus]MDF1613843.1 hypothetical protein [Desulfurivibrio alkaliphilus]